MNNTGLLNNIRLSHLPTRGCDKKASAASQALFAVVLFSLTVPATQMALTAFSPEFIAASRAMIAGVLAWFVVNISGWNFPERRVIPWLLLAGVGVIAGFPYALSISLTHIPAADMGVVLAGLPLVTSLLASIMHGERNGIQFWALSALGCGLLGLYVVTNLGQLPQFEVQHLGLLLLTLLLGGIGYSAGAKAAKIIGGWQTICWTLVIYLPLSALAWGYSWALEAEQLRRPVDWQPFAALMYLALFSQLWGFKFWYQALAQAGVGRISQLQLLQPFFTLAFISLILQQSITIVQIVFCLLIVLTVMASMRVTRS
jgi:drug/metabolite transporter (DMT)-like permease